MILAAALLAAQIPVPSAPRKPHVAPAEAGCAVPVVDAGTPLFVAGFYEGEAISTQALDGQEEVTSVADMVMEPGPGRVTLVLTTYGSMVFRFGGAVRRIDRVIVLHQSNVGISGVPAAKVEFVDAEPCDLPYTVYEGPTALYDPRLEQLFGRPADWMGGTYSLYRARIGARGLTIEEAPPTDRPADRLEAEFRRFSPGGIVEVDPRSLVASAPPEPYDVLPQQAGLLQLVRAGAIRPASRAELDQWLGVAARRGAYTTGSLASLRSSVLDLYRVLRPIDVPAGLCGAHGVTFLARTPEDLDGSLCHSSALFADGTAKAGLVAASAPRERE